MKSVSTLKYIYDNGITLANRSIDLVVPRKLYSFYTEGRGGVLVNVLAFLFLDENLESIPTIHKF